MRLKARLRKARIMFVVARANFEAELYMHKWYRKLVQFRIKVVRSISKVVKASALWGPRNKGRLF